MQIFKIRIRSPLR